MKFRSIPFALFLLLISSASAFAVSDDGKSEAARTCRSISYSAHDAKDCLAEIRKARSFDPRALTVCEGISASSSKLVQCMRAAANKAYEGWEADACSALSHSASTVVKCISEGGKAIAQPEVFRFSEPKQIAVRDVRSSLIGGLTELIPNTGIYVTARHVLQGRSAAEIAESFSRSALDSKSYRFYTLKNQGKVLDAVLAVPKGKESLILEFATEKNCNAESSFPALQIKDHAGITRDVNLSDPYISFQYGTLASGSEEEELKQISQGLISRVGADRFFLALSPENATTARSSGSVIYTAKPAEAGSKPEYRFAGIVECVIPPNKNERGVPVPGAVRVISSGALLDAEVAPISIEALLRDRIPADPGCIPIDGGRDAGGE